MSTWRPTFLVEPFPDTPWDRRELERWRQTAPNHAYAAVAQRRSVQISLDVDAEEEGAAIAAARAQVDASFPPWRYNVQNPPAPEVTAAAKQALAAGVAAHLRRTDPQWSDGADDLASPDVRPEHATFRRPGADMLIEEPRQFRPRR